MAHRFVREICFTNGKRLIKLRVNLSKECNRFRVTSATSSTIESTVNGTTVTATSHNDRTSIKYKNAFKGSSKNSSRPSSDDPFDISFDNTKEAYKSKRTSELSRAYFILQLTSFDFLVKNNEKLIKLGRKLLGGPLFRFIMRRTFYGQFVAGEDEKQIRPVIDHLRSFGVKSILDYSAEEDLSEEEAVKTEYLSVSSSNSEHDPGKLPEMKQEADNVNLSESHTEKDPLIKYKPQLEFMDRRKFNPVARTYFYLNEAQCEKNMETFMKCIDAVAGVTAHTGFAAIKLTALGRPQLLLQLSEVIARSRSYFKEVTGIDNMALGTVTPEEFQKQLDRRFNVTTSNEEVRKWLDGMDYDRRGLMNLFSWNGLIDTQHLINDLFMVPNIKTGKLERIISALSKEEEEMFRNMMRRIHTIARHARDTDVRVMVDAEQTYFQPAINRITMELMRKYNKHKAIFFNTYQCYLKDAYCNAMLDIELARRQNFYFGAKLVRGAYMEQERMRAKKVGYEDPINENFEATTEMYHKTLSKLMEDIVKSGIENKKIAIMVASHNEQTVKYTVKKMNEVGIEPHHKVICFGQLYGMCDQISFTLGQSGYSVYKYVPYGPIDEVIPYLSRRAAENHGILKKVGREKALLRTEILRRLFAGQIFHKPIGNYTPV